MPTDAAPANAVAAVATRGARLATPEIVLLALLIGELVWFSLAGTNFLTFDNGLEIVRASTEVGLLALALTPVILTGGIELSCGALLGLSAVVFGAIWRDGGQSRSPKGSPAAPSTTRASPPGSSISARAASSACRRRPGCWSPRSW